MAKKRNPGKRVDPTAERLLDLLIVQLAFAGVTQHAIRKVAGCNMNRVVRLTKHVKPWLRGPDNAEK